MNDILHIEKSTSKLYRIMGVKIMLDRDFADFYEVETGQEKRAVRRNLDRFN